MEKDEKGKEGGREERLAIICATHGRMWTTGKIKVCTPSLRLCRIANDIGGGF